MLFLDISIIKLEFTPEAPPESRRSWSGVEYISKCPEQRWSGVKYNFQLPGVEVEWSVFPLAGVGVEVEWSLPGVCPPLVTTQCF